MLSLAVCSALPVLKVFFDCFHHELSCALLARNVFVSVADIRAIFKAMKNDHFEACVVESRQCLSLIQGKVMAIAVLAGLERNLTNSSLYKIGGLLWIMTCGRGSGRAPEVKLRFLPGSLFINIIIITYYLLLLLLFLINIIYYYYESCFFLQL